jgi:hypothetical protein
MGNQPTTQSVIVISVALGSVALRKRRVGYGVPSGTANNVHSSPTTAKVCTLQFCAARFTSCTVPYLAQSSRWLTCVIISDTHSKHDEISSLPAGDVLIHCGDFTRKGYLSEIQAFAAWLAKQPHPHKLVIAGNHELTLDPPFYKYACGWNVLEWLLWCVKCVSQRSQEKMEGLAQN